MDTSDPDIQFDQKGHCNHCNMYYQHQAPLWYKGTDGQRRLDALIAEMKAYGKGKDYDCIVGLSGGTDSAYLAYLCASWGLRVLAIHVDAGWNSELAVKNIESICTKLKIDLITEVIDWEAMKRLQKAFFRSQVVNQDIPQDHSFFAALYKFATKHRVKYVINGYNIATESILPLAWRGYPAMDSTHVRAIYRKHGEGKLGNFPILGTWKLRLFYRLFYSLKIVSPLNFIDYNKPEALRLLIEQLGFKDYGGKHLESNFTRFHQLYFLPQKFGYQKRRAHLSGLVVTGQITRDHALELMKEPLYPSPIDQQNDIEYFAKKIGISMDEFHTLMEGPKGRHEDYPSEHTLNQRFDKISAFLRKLLGR
jgi:aminotransferase